MRLFSKRGALSSAASFVGIGGAAAPAAKTAEPDAKDPKAEGDDEDMKKGDKEPEATTAAAASTEDEDDCDEDGDDESDETEIKKTGKKANARAARMRERSRIARIMSHPKAAAHADFALKMALTTDFGRGKIIAMLDMMPAPVAQTASLTSRMETEANRHVGAAPPAQSSQQQIEAGWDRAAARAKDPFAL
jgi:hypothetical protein